MKKVLLSAYACIPGRGSEPGNGWNWAYFLSKEGHEVHLITTSKGRKEIDQIITNESIKNIHVHYVDHSYFWSKAYYWNFIFMYTAYWLWQNKILKLAKILHTSDPFDVVHHVTWGSIKVGSSLYRLKNTKFIYGPAGGGHKAPKAFKKYFYKEWNKERFRNFAGELISFINPLTKKTLINSDIVLVANQETFDYAKRNGAKNAKLIVDSALPPDYLPNTINNKSNTIIQFLWVGRMYAFKGMGLILDALELLDAEVKNQIHLNVVGDGPFMAELRQLILQKKLNDTITLHGLLPYNVVKSMYESVDVFIFCSLRDSCPAQHLEAMAFGLPVITLNLHGSKLVVPDNAGLKVPVDNPDKTIEMIATAIKELTLNTELRRKLGHAAYNFAKINTWDVKVKHIIQSYYS
ncbi:glycosyltransferase family 4 protein [Botryobacter ruber]|uniref:glycosyltransferase family 4 protein n=1 Tax=Botryobacter ruber TaxID=2171629 RepID=UPI000E0A0B2C|nr:glycosyltransferase family 4 protein [Botryobacter ruber]